MGWTSHGRNDLPHVRFNSTDMEVVNSPSNIYARGASPLLKGTTTHCSDKTRHHLVEGLIPSFGSYGAQAGAEGRLVHPHRPPRGKA
jgi:hypothetical protein